VRRIFRFNGKEIKAKERKSRKITTRNGIG